MARAVQQTRPVVDPLPANKILLEPSPRRVRVRFADTTIADSQGVLLMMEGRARDQGEWPAAARRLAATAEKALKAAEAKDAAGVFAAGGEIYNACSACHRRYAPQLNADSGAR